MVSSSAVVILYLITGASIASFYHTRHDTHQYDPCHQSPSPIPCGQGDRTPPGGARSLNVTFFLVSGKSTHLFEKVRKKSLKKSGTTGSSVVKFHVSESSGARRK
jgi:hypothetical protein